MYDLGLSLIAVLLLLVGLFALRRQTKATSCPRHSHWAGALGVTVGWLALVLGVALFGYALLFAN